MNLPNALTLLRLLLVPLFVWQVAAHRYAAALVTFLAAGATDGLDGYIARHANQRTRLGTALDPVADKVLMLSALFSLGDDAHRVQVPGWLAYLVLGRDLTLLAAALIVVARGGRREFAPSWWGKLTTVSLIALLAAVLVDNLRGSVGPLFLPLCAAAVLFTALSLADYLRTAWRRLPSGGGA